MSWAYHILDTSQGLRLLGFGLTWNTAESYVWVPYITIWVVVVVVVVVAVVVVVVVVVGVVVVVVVVPISSCLHPCRGRRPCLEEPWLLCRRLEFLCPDALL